MSNYEEISRRAEADLNTYQSKTGEARPQGLDDDAGVNTFAEKKFNDANVSYGDDLTTNAGYNRRIPPEEGGDLDARGRSTRGEHFEGVGGPEDKFQEDGTNDDDVVPARVRNVQGSRGDILTEGQEATKINVGDNPSGPGGSQFKGSDYYTPESVPDSISAEGNVAPDSITQSSREAENN